MQQQNLMSYITAPWRSAWCRGLVHHLQTRLFLPGVCEKLHGQANVPCSLLTPFFDPKTFLVGICNVKWLYDIYTKNSWQHKEAISEDKNYLLHKSIPWKEWFARIHQDYLHHSAHIKLYHKHKAEHDTYVFFLTAELSTSGSFLTLTSSTLSSSDSGPSTFELL